MNLVTNYLGLPLRSPVIVSANPLSEKIDNIRRMEDAGAGAVVLYSLFEEQLTAQQLNLHHHLTYATESHSEAVNYFPALEPFHTGPEAYLDLIRQAKAAVDIPIIASLNATIRGSWARFATLMEQAGADALELNIYYIPTDMDKTGADVEQEYLNILRSVRAHVHLPIAVKLSPYFSNIANMARQLSANGADGLVLFNRFYQPDIDLETFEVYPHVLLSAPQDMRLPLRWIAILYGRLNIDLAATSGIHSGQDVLKMIMAGANVTMMASALLSRGIDHLRTVEHEIRTWLEVNEYESIAQLRGSMSQMNCPNPGAFERAQYMRALTTYYGHA
ncbi:MAG: dihydroorotate dehydrogenase-like protein [Aggregatilineales bacterium]